ncbi:MAG TPA: hypothetical protein VJS37_06245 [Terriglobales bacterium]|nr:hypothetical protein [Terriglobales bacterium]
MKRVQCLSQRILAFVTNISVGGCYILMPYPLSKETTVSVALWLDEHHKVFRSGDYYGL